jgi:hypothetical protein
MTPTLQGFLASRDRGLREDEAEARDILAVAGLKQRAQEAQAMRAERAAELQQRTADRQAALQQKAMEVELAYGQRQEALDQRRAEFQQRTADANARAAFEQKYKLDQAKVAQEREMWNRYFAQQGLDVKKMLAEQKKPAEQGQTPENAGKVAMADQSVQSIQVARGKIFDKNGKLNRMLIGAVNLPIVAGLPGNSEARIVRSALRNAIEAKLRLETGAAATESEVERTLARFMPTIADTDESAKFKLDELEKFFKNALSITKGAKPAQPGAAAPNNDPLGTRGN